MRTATWLTWRKLHLDLQANLATWLTWRRSHLALAQATWLGAHLADPPGVKANLAHLATWRYIRLQSVSVSVSVSLGLVHGHVLGSVLVSILVSASISVSSRSSTRFRFALGQWFGEASDMSPALQPPLKTAAVADYLFLGSLPTKKPSKSSPRFCKMLPPY